MPHSGESAELRARAVHVRQLASGLSPEDRQRLLDFAEELEDRAVAAEAEGGIQPPERPQS